MHNAEILHAEKCPVIKMIGSEPAVADAIRENCPDDVDLETLDDQADLSSHLEEDGQPVDVVLLGTSPDLAVQIAQRIHTIDKFLPVIILTRPEACRPLRRTLMFSPFLGSEVIPWSSEDLTALPNALMEAVNRRRQRQRHHHALCRAQVRFEKLPHLKPELNQYLDQLLDCAPIGVMTIDASGVILTLNHQAQEILNATNRITLGGALNDLFSKDDHPVIANLRTEIATGRSPSAQRTVRLRETDSVRKYIAITMAPLCYRNTMRQPGLMVILQDVTSRVDAEAERRDAEEKLRKHVKTLRKFHEISTREDICFDEKLSGVLKLACAQFGLAAGMVTSINGEEFDIIASVGSMDLDGLQNAGLHSNRFCFRAIKSKEPYTYVGDGQGPNCSGINKSCETPVAYIGVRYLVNDIIEGTLCFWGNKAESDEFTDADKELIKMMGQWLGREWQRARSEARMRKLSSALEQAADAVMITDRNRMIEYVNGSFECMTGYSKEELIGRPAGVLRSGFHDQEFYNQIWRLISSGKAYRGELVNRKKDGSIYHEQRTITPLRDANGEITHFISTGHDITELVETQRQNRLHQSELTHVARLSTLGEMTSGLAHELNQPLCAITTFTQTCLRMLSAGEYKPDDLYYGLQQVLRQAETATEIFRRLRMFSRKGEIEECSVELGQIVGEIESFVESEALQNLINVHFDVPDRLPPVWADRIQLEQVLLNLVRNAMEAVSERDPGCRNVTITATRNEETEVTVDVRDSGHGCPPDIANRLFEPFFTTKEKGMGVGLGISQSIVEAHGGRLWLEETSPQGSVFRFTVPQAKGEKDE
ncbi:PAS domain S-box protein [Thioalkalivibrio sp. ALJ2]|uniref:PAS domain S-box protein n=1 Tax=Thioalkalivibrio sp. ALJ2 TaxID=1261622 RepID=UPI000378C69E|nr:PAS domain S-box protein [Thioalkalivibrio sp. ALJ2]